MAEECTHNCESCSADCASRSKNGNTGKESLLIPANPASEVKHIIGVVSGKGGVGKSLVTSMLAVLLRREGFRVGIMDADITGPSIPKAFGVHNVRIYGDDNGMIPPATTTGIDMISVNLLLGEDETRPVIWRGAMISGVVQQFWKDTIWNEDILLVDCPPGTGDVPLTVFQSMPLDGIIIVSSPQDLVSMIVSKAANMASMMNIPVLGLVENMSYALCPDCGKRIELFGKSKIAQEAAALHLPVLAQLPFDPKAAQLCDEGSIETVENPLMADAARAVAGQVGL